MESTAEFEFNEIAKTLDIEGVSSFSGLQDIVFRSVQKRVMHLYYLLIKFVGILNIL